MLEASDESYIALDDGLKNPEPSTSSISPAMKNIGKKTLPLLVTGVIKTGEDFVKMYAISQLGDKAVGANALIGLTLGLLTNTGAFLGPTAVLIGNACGEENLNKAGVVLNNSWLLSTLISVPTSLAMWNADNFLKFFDQSSELIEMVGSYAKPACFSVLPSFWLMLDTDFLRATGNEMDLIPWTIFSSAIGVSTTYLFVKANDQDPTAGFTGAGYASLIQSWACWLAMRGYTSLNKKFNDYKLYDKNGITLAVCKTILKLGTPLFFVSLGQQLSGFFLGVMTGNLGHIQLALNQVINQYLMFLTPPMASIRLANQTLIAQYKGLNNAIEVYKHGNIGIACDAIINLLPLIFLGLFPNQLAKVFISEQELSEVNDIIRLIFITKALARLLDVVQSSASDNLKAISDNWVPSIINLLTSFALTLTLSYVFAFIYDMDLLGLNIAANISSGAGMILMLSRWHQVMSPILQDSEKNAIGINNNRHGFFASSSSAQNQLPHKKNPETELVEVENQLSSNNNGL